MKAQRVVLWSGTALLAAIGISAAFGRAVAIATDVPSNEMFKSMLPAGAAQETDEFGRWFAAYPVLTFLHIIPGAVILTLAPFQFSSGIRRRHIRFHRWSGRVVLLAALAAVLSALLLGAISPFGGLTAASAVAVFGVFFLVALLRAFLAIRRGDVARHREWMIRMLSICLGIATIRIIGLLLVLTTRARPLEVIGLSFWLGWGLTFGAAELWVRYTRRAGASRAAG
jgi:uncharacterized membrane protein